MKRPQAYKLCKFALNFTPKQIFMRPFVSRFTFLVGLLLVLTGVGLNLEEKTTLAIVLIIAGLLVTFISLSLMVRKKKDDDDQAYPEPNPEDFTADDQDTPLVEEKEKK